MDDNWPVSTHSASLWMFTLRTTRVVSNFWEKWKIFKPSEEYGSKTDWHEKHIFWTSESWFISTSLFGPIQTKCVNANFGAFDTNYIFISTDFLPNWVSMLHFTVTRSSGNWSILNIKYAVHSACEKPVDYIPR